MLSTELLTIYSLLWISPQIKEKKDTDISYSQTVNKL